MFGFVTGLKNEICYTFIPLVSFIIALRTRVFAYLLFMKVSDDIYNSGFR